MYQEYTKTKGQAKLEGRQTNQKHYVPQTSENINMLLINELHNLQQENKIFKSLKNVLACQHSDRQAKKNYQ